MRQGACPIRIEPVTDFNLKHTLECGQSFRWQPSTNGWYCGVVDGRQLRIRQEHQTLIVKSSVDERGDQLEAFLRHYLDLNRDLPAILDAVDIDPFIHRSIETFRGMRILNQEVWECLASFILSQNNNVPRIKGIIRTISARFGEKITLDDSVDYAFRHRKPLRKPALRRCTIVGWDTVLLMCGQFRRRLQQGNSTLRL